MSEAKILDVYAGHDVANYLSYNRFIFFLHGGAYLLSNNFAYYIETRVDSLRKK
jgi:hypothetical protein